MTGVNPDTRTKDLTDDEVVKLRDAIDHNFVVEGDLRRDVQMDIKRLIDIGCYRGRRHRLGSEYQKQRSHSQRSQETRSGQEEGLRIKDSGFGFQDSGNSKNNP